LDAVIEQLVEATKLDPSYAPPYAAVSNAYIAATQTSFLPPKDTFPKAKAAALRAVELDDRLAEGHAALSQVYLWHDWNWAGAEQEIRRALQLNPDSIDALTASESYSLLVKGNVDEAVATSQRIVDVDPLNPFVRVQTIWTSYLSRQQDDSIRHSKTLIELAPDAWFPHFFLAMNYAVKHMRPEVNTECDKVSALLRGRYDMQSLATCVWALGSVGETEKARRLLEVVEHPPSGVWLDPVMMAAAYTGLGDTDRAIDWYQKGFEERSPNMVYMKTSPGAWDAVRGDARFQSIQRQMGFPSH
jgi:tetratricopeptide (TPR) repeat protein